MKLVDQRFVLVLICCILFALVASGQADHKIAQQEIGVMGTWWTVQYGNYEEIVFGDSVMWSYSDLAGATSYRYETRDSVLMRETRPWGVTFTPLTIEYVTADSMKLSLLGHGVVYHRATDDTDEAVKEKLFANDPEALAAFVKGYNARSKKVQDDGGS
jgi:hypothetical protein